MRVLVTGAAGFVGLNLVRRFAMDGAVVDALARRHPDAAAETFLKDVSARVHWRVGDVTDRSGCIALVESTRPDAIVHAAAVTFTPAQERANPAHVFDVNAGGTLHMLESARLAGVTTFVYVSSGGLYGAAPPEPALDETATVRPGNMYAISKIASEQVCSRYAELTEMHVRVGRLGTAYGPMERTTGSRSNLSVVQQAVEAAGRDDGSLRVAGADVARDFCHIDDVVEAYHELTVSDTLPETVYNVGSPVSEPLSVALDVLAEETPGFSWRSVDDAVQAEIVQTSAQARAAMNVNRLQRDTSWRPRYTLSDGVRAYLAWRRRLPELVSQMEHRS